MSGCTETDKPRIAILLAVYEPRMDWLRELLASLNAQTYPNIKLYVRDDYSPTVPFEQIEACVREEISAFDYEISRNERNLGSNGTFERLTQQAEGEYFAYCDQDDVWLPEKLETLEAAMTENAQMAYSDMMAIDGRGQKIADSLKEIRPRICYVQGEGLAETYFFRNCTAGCCMMVRAESAKSAVPFPSGTVCDQWLAIVAAHRGSIRFVSQPLLSYRQHDHNQTGILSGVVDKESYYQKRVVPLAERFAAYRRIAEPSPEMEKFIAARCEKRIGGLVRYGKISSREALFELALCVMPEWMIKRLLRRLT